MKANRKRSRKFLFQELYAESFNSYNEEEFLASFYEGKFTFEVDKYYIQEIKKIIKERKDFFDEIIQTYAPKFNIKQMSQCYIIPIYIALSEIFYLKEEIPIKVSVNEAIEVTKTYADDAGKKMVNGILNKVIENYDSLQKKVN